MTQKTAYINVHMVDPLSGFDGKGSLLIDGNRIIAMGEIATGDIGSEYTQKTLSDAQVIIPGLVDFRCHIPDLGEEEKGDFHSEGKAALSAAITSLAVMPDSTPVVDSAAEVVFRRARADQEGLPKIYPWGAMTKSLSGQNLAELGLMSQAGAIGFSDANNPIESTALMRRALQYSEPLGLLLSVHPIDASVGSGAMNASSLAIRLGLSGSSYHAEAMRIERDLRLLEMTGGRLHIQHISCAESVRLIAEGKNKGLNVTCDTAPPYFTLNELATSGWTSFAKLNPPLRDEKDRLAIIEALKDGTIDVIASDHLPQDEEAKRLPFDQASFGGVGVESLLPLVLSLYHQKALSLPQALSYVTYKPAQLLGIEAGTLAQGKPADFAIIDLDHGFKFDDKNLKSRTRNSPFGGHLMQGKCFKTFVNGQCVYTLDES